MTLLLPGATFRSAEEALLPFRPDVDGPFGARETAHLVRRAAFGAPVAERARLAALGPAGAVEDITAEQPPSGEYAALLAALAPLASVDDLVTCQSLWLARMLHDPRPFREALALFWHGHFATSVSKVGRERLLVRQVDTLRRLGAGPLEPLVLAVARNPAMIVWLDGNDNRRHHPNENFARELMELFTLGRGHYDERDVLEAARAFTGWQERDGVFRDVPGEHDDGEKEVLGVRGPLAGEDVVRACLAQPACAAHVAGRLFRHFVRPDPEPELLEVLAVRYRDTGLDTLALLRLLFTSRAFYEPRAHRALIAAPVAHAIGAARSLGLRPDCKLLADRVAGLGQSLYAPPSVKGWDGGHAWINPATLIGRVNLGALYGELAAQHADEFAAAAGGRHTQALLDALLDGDAPDAARARLDELPGDLAGQVQTLLALPEAQLA